MNNKIFWALFLSFIGDHFYILFVSLILLKASYSPEFVSFAIAATALPNLIFGPKLGRFVDQSDKLKLHTNLSLALALLVNVLGIVVFLMKLSSLTKTLVFLLMLTYNCLSSPLSSLLYQYLIPTLEIDESKAFLKWERFQAVGTFAASIFGYLILKFNFEILLLILDSITFVVCAVIVAKHWLGIRLNKSDDVTHSAMTVPAKSKWLNLLKADANRRTLATAGLSALVFVFAVDSHTYNTGILFFSQLNFEITYIPLIMSALSLFNLLGSYVYERYFSGFGTEVSHRWSLLLVVLFLTMLFIGVLNHKSIVVILALILLQTIEPVWSTTNSVLMRAQVKDNSYGEFFGYFRILRSISTAGGVYLYGLSQQYQNLNLFIFFGIFIMAVVIIYDLVITHKVELKNA